MTPTETYVIGQRSNGEPCVLSMVKENAQAVGWASQFPTFRDWYGAQIQAGLRQGYYGRRSRICGSRTYVLSRSPNRQGWTKGMTHSFRVSRNVKNELLAETLEKLQVEWHWVALPGGMRRAKEDWLDMIPVTP